MDVGEQSDAGRPGEWLADEFEASRSRLRAVAYRMLGSMSEAEDAVQESWLRLNRFDAGAVDNLRSWLTTVVGRICLDMLRARRARNEEFAGMELPEPVVELHPLDDPEHEAELADSVGLALLVVLETLTPAERLAFVLHDMFDVSFEEIGEVVGRTPAAARQLASRARRRVRGAAPGPTPTTPPSGAWSTPSRRPHAPATSRHCSTCSTPPSSSAQTRASPRRVPAGLLSAPGPSPCRCSSAAGPSPPSAGRLWSTALPGWSWPTVSACSRWSASASSRAASRPSTWWPTQGKLHGVNFRR